MAFLPDAKIQVRNGDGKLFQYDRALNYIFAGDGDVDQVQAYVRYPLKVGDEWTYATKSGSLQGITSASVKVATYESITVPAGTFSCYRLDIVENYGNKGYGEFVLRTRWYCPEVKWIAKERVETSITHANGKFETTVTVSELVKFTAGN